MCFDLAGYATDVHIRLTESLYLVHVDRKAVSITLGIVAMVYNIVLNLVAYCRLLRIPQLDLERLGGT